MISAKIVADSINEFGDRLTSLEVVLPRYILAEGKTHRIIKGALGQVDIDILESIGLNDFPEGSKNSASSRAIKFEKMAKSVIENPFIPYAWQKEHTGMQGFEYITDPDQIQILTDNHLYLRDCAVAIATQSTREGLTKQICNRYLEPFMWHKVLISATEWENFFALRCPQYSIEKLIDGDTRIFRSRKDLIKALDYDPIYPNSVIDWLQINKGMADIHMMFLAEAIWDAMNESKPKQLKAGEWHIVYEDKVDLEKIAHAIGEADVIGNSRMLNKERYLPEIIKITTGMAARASYTVVGDEKEIKYETLMGIHDRMREQVPFHASPFEHNSKAMSAEERDNFLKMEDGMVQEGWCRNYRGFIQHRHFIESASHYINK